MSIILDGADKAASRTSLGLSIGTDVLAPNGSAASLTNVPAAQLTGTVADSALPANIQSFPAPGASGQTLQSDGTNWTSAAAAGGGQLELIQKVVANNSADITITGLGAHDTYLIIGNHLDPVTSSVEDQLTLGKSDGTFATAYFCAAQSLETDSGVSPTQFQRTQGGPAFLTMRVNNMIARSNSGVGTGVNNSVNFKYILAANSGTSDGIIYGNFTYPKTNGAMAGGVLHGVSQFLGTTTFDRIKYKFSSGNIDTGSITVFAVKNS